MKKAKAHIYISGDVTGVGFRYWTVQQAKDLDISGWVRNADRDQVEVVVEGKKEKIEKFMERLRSGPETSLVKDIEVKWEEANDDFTGFEIRY